MLIMGLSVNNIASYRKQQHHIQINKSSAGQSITLYNSTSDEHGGEGACIIFIQSRKVTKTTSEFEPNSRQTGNLVSLIMRFLWSIDHILSAIIIKLFCNNPFSLIAHLMTLYPLVDY